MTTFARVVCVSVAALLALLLVIALPSEPLDQPEDHTLGGVAPVSLGPISSAIPAESSVLVPISNKPVLKARVAQDFDKLPFYFVENQGQLDEQVAFYIQGSDKTIYFAPDGVTFALTAPLTPTISPQEKSLDSRQLSADKPEMQEVQRWAVKLDFVGANPNVRPIGQDKTEAVISYFKGPQDQWYAGLPTYSRIVYRGLWPGIDLVYYGTVNQLKYEFIVHPGVDPNQIRLAYHGADVALNANGQLLVTTPLGELNDEKPVAYQDIDGQRVTVPMSYHISKGTNQSSSPTLYGFQLDPYDTSHPIILDPSMLVYCGYIGGSYYDEGWGTAVDTSGNVYVAGFTGSSQFSFPVTIGPDLVYHGGGDAFVAKVNATGTALIYAGYIGGADDDTGFRIAADQFGNAYITGWTFSDQNTFPILGGPDLTYNGGADAFVAKVNVTGTALVFSGYIGGADFDQGRGISVDATGNVYIAGITESDETTFPVTVGPDLTFNGGSTYGAEDAFVAKVNATGSALIYAGYIGGAGDDVGFQLATDGLGNAYVTGRTTSDQTTFPVTVGPDLTYNGGDPYGDAFVAKVNPIGTALIYAGYIGGSEGDYGRGIAVDRLGNAYVTGLTDSEQSSFPVINGPDLTYNGYTDSFVVKVNVTGTALVYAGYIGGSGTDWGESIAVDSTGSAYVIGSTDSTQATFPVTAGPDLTYNGGYHDAFIVKVTESGTGLAYAGYLGGAGDDLGYGISVDNSGNAYVTGWTTSDQLTFPVTVGPDTTYNSEMTSNSGRDAFVAKVRGPGSGIVSVVGHHLERDGVIFEARGMNYFPKDYAWDRFWISYTLAPTQTNVELDQAKALGVNTVRIFLPYNLFDGTGQSASYLGYLEDFVSRLQARDMAALVTLFDYYPTYSTRPYSTTDYISSTRHISAVVNTLGVTNPAIMAWDIKNELDRDYAPYGKAQVQAWAFEMISYTRQLDPNHLITIGVYGAVTTTDGLVYSPTLAAELTPAVDFVSLHYFLSERQFENDLQALRAQIGEKPLVLEEFGLHTLANPSVSCVISPTAPHCDDPHTEAEQAAYYNALLSLSEAYGLAGYSYWTLTDFSYIVSGTQESHHCQGILRNGLVNTCEVTITVDYAEKPAAETIRRHYADHVAYLDLFDGWVDPNTDLPAAGWSDNWQDGGTLLRDYNPANSLWSHDLGKVALSKFVSNSISFTGTALSPVLTDVNVSRYPIVAGQVYSYSIRDALNGSDSILNVGVKEGAWFTPLLTIRPTTTLPYTFAVDLRQPPLNWSGNHNFQIALQLVPQTPGNGYSATYEFDWIGLLAAPQANFAAQPDMGVVPFTVIFTNTSIGDSMQSQWDFGDGVTSAVDSPTHTYSIRGTYTVTLFVTGLGGVDTLTRTNYITAYAPVYAGFTASPVSGVAPLTLTYTNTSTGDYTISLWNFGDGLTSTLTSLTHIYSVPGVYSVTLTVSGPGGTDTLTRTNYITAYTRTQADFTASPTSGIRPLTVTFTNTSTGDYGNNLWDFGDELTSDLPNPAHIYSTPGVYTVKLTVSGLGGEDTESKASFITVWHGVYLPIILR